MGTFALRGLAASQLNHCDYTGSHPLHRRRPATSFYVGCPYSVTVRSIWDVSPRTFGYFRCAPGYSTVFTQLDAVCDPGVSGQRSSITRFPSRLRTLSHDRHSPKIQYSRGAGSDSGHTPFTSLCLQGIRKTQYLATGWLTIPYPGVLFAHAFPLDNEPLPG